MWILALFWCKVLQTARPLRKQSLLARQLSTVVPGRHCGQRGRLRWTLLMWRIFYLTVIVILYVFVHNVSSQNSSLETEFWLHFLYLLVPDDIFREAWWAYMPYRVTDLLFYISYPSFGRTSGLWVFKCIHAAAGCISIRWLVASVFWEYWNLIWWLIIMASNVNCFLSSWALM